MPLNRYVVRVDPQGQTVTVDVRDTSGVSAAVFESSQFDAAALTLPLVISSQTEFWLRSPGPYDVSCLVGGAEVAAAGAPKRVQVSDVPVLVVPDWERQRTAATTGGSLPTPTVETALHLVRVNAGGDGFELALDTVRFRAGIVWSGGKTNAGTAGWINLSEGQGNVAQGCSVGILGAGEEVWPVLKFPTFSAGEVTIIYAELSVTAVDGSSRRILGASTPPIAVVSGDDYPMVAADWVDGEEWTVIGSDLTLGTHGIATTAGGVFAVGIYVDYTATGLVP